MLINMDKGRQQKTTHRPKISPCGAYVAEITVLQKTSCMRFLLLVYSKLHVLATDVLGYLQD